MARRHARLDAGLKRTCKLLQHRPFAPIPSRYREPRAGEREREREKERTERMGGGGSGSRGSIGTARSGLDCHRYSAATILIFSGKYAARKVCAETIANTESGVSCSKKTPMYFFVCSRACSIAPKSAGAVLFRFSHACLTISNQSLNAWPQEPQYLNVSRAIFPHCVQNLFVRLMCVSTAPPHRLARRVFFGCRL